MKRYSLSSVIIITSLSQTGNPPNGVQKSSSRGQSHFDVEYEFGAHPIKRPVGIPKDVLDILRGDRRRVVPCAKAQTISADQIPGDWFVASIIHLGDPSERDLLVQPRFDLDLRPSNRCLSGANTRPFWVFREKSSGYQLILVTGGHDLVVLESRTMGNWDIETAIVSLRGIFTTIYRFDGHEYKPEKTKAEQIH